MLDGDFPWNPPAVSEGAALASCRPEAFRDGSIWRDESIESRGKSGKSRLKMIFHGSWMVVQWYSLILVGGNWLPFFGMFPEILGFDYHPNWRTHIFQRGGPTTNQNSLISGFFSNFETDGW